MADIDLTQEEADALIAMPKNRTTDDIFYFYHNTPMLASGIKGMLIQLRKGSDLFSTIFMRRRCSCPAACGGVRRRRLTGNSVEKEVVFQLSLVNPKISLHTSTIAVIHRQSLRTLT
jgi:hypothetical protein